MKKSNKSLKAKTKKKVKTNKASKKDTLTSHQENIHGKIPMAAILHKESSTMINDAMLGEYHIKVDSRSFTVTKDIMTKNKKTGKLTKSSTNIGYYPDITSSLVSIGNRFIADKKEIINIVEAINIFNYIFKSYEDAGTIRRTHKPKVS